jgi:SNF2 family DNA or RNA helicase
MYLQSQKVYNFSLVALDYGLGKTLCSLVYLILSTRQKINFNTLYPDKKKAFRASIVCCSPAAIEVWYQDVQKFFPKGPIKIYQFYGTPKTVSNSRLVRQGL